MDKLVKWAAIQIYYYLIAADGEICGQEMETFLEIATQTDPLFEQYKDSLIEECRNQVNKITGEENRYAVIKEGVDLVHRDQRKEILREIDWKSGHINASMFIWNMLCIAMSDGRYADEEQEIIRYVIERFGLNKVVFLELENAMKAIQDIDKSIARMVEKENPFVIRGKIWDISSTDKGQFIDEFKNRREVIFNSVKQTTQN